MEKDKLSYGEVMEIACKRFERIQELEEQYREQLDNNGCLCDKIEKLEDKNEVLQQRIDKAIEYIENCNHGTEEYKIYEIATIGVEELLDILKGGNNE